MEVGVRLGFGNRPDVVGVRPLEPPTRTLPRDGGRGLLEVGPRILGHSAQYAPKNMAGGALDVAAIVISEEKYRDKVYACWLGKNIGGTLGAPVEGQKKVHEFIFYDPFPEKSAPNDDLDFQLVWLQMVKERGPHIRVADFADYWKKYLVAYPWNEYGFCQRNLARGLMPPITGCFENYFVDEMGSPIRSEILGLPRSRRPADSGGVRMEGFGARSRGRGRDARGDVLECGGERGVRGR